MGAASPLLTLPSSAADLERIEATLRASVQTGDPYLTEIASHLIVAGGKRLRPVLSAVAALTQRDHASDDVVRGGVSVELVHIGSLYHDDVMDEAELRRAQPSVNARWGNLTAILAGDFLLSRASEIAASLGTEVAGLLASTIGRLCHGQIGELRSAFDVGRTVPAYLDSIEGKTASLFAAACRIGAIVAGLDRAAIDALTSYGLHFGMVFQIADDVLDLTASEEQLGKPTGHDLVEGVYTLPVIDMLAKDDAASGELRDLLGHPIEGPELDKALALVRSNGAVPAAIEQARSYAAAAVEALAPFHRNAALDALAAAPDHLLDSLTP
jgi:heptaprenyl diphosphate synthase